MRGRNGRISGSALTSAVNLLAPQITTKETDTGVPVNSAEKQITRNQQACRKRVFHGI